MTTSAMAGLLTNIVVCLAPWPTPSPPCVQHPKPETLNRHSFSQAPEPLHRCAPDMIPVNVMTSRSTSAGEGGPSYHMRAVMQWVP